MSNFENLAIGALSACLAAFGRTVSYAPAGGVVFSLEALLGDAPEPYEIAAGRTLALKVRLSDFATPPAKGDRVTIGTAEYVVCEVEPDEYEVGAQLLIRESA